MLLPSLGGEKIWASILFFFHLSPVSLGNRDLVFQFENYIIRALTFPFFPENSNRRLM